MVVRNQDRIRHLLSNNCALLVLERENHLKAFLFALVSAIARYPHRCRHLETAFGRNVLLAIACGILRDLGRFEWQVLVGIEDHHALRLESLPMLLLFFLFRKLAPKVAKPKDKKLNPWDQANMLQNMKQENVLITLPEQTRQDQRYVYREYAGRSWTDLEAGLIAHSELKK